LLTNGKGTVGIARSWTKATEFFFLFFKCILEVAMFDGFLVTTACRVLGLQMEERPLAMEGSCEYIKQAAADKRQGVVLQLGGWAWGKQPFTVKK
jgi:hypothetical protein